MTFPDLARGVLINLFMLLGFVALASMTRRLKGSPARYLPAWAEGLLFGLMAVLAMAVPSVTSPGVIFDCRSGVIGAGALLGGPVCALTSILFPGLFRLHIGGPGVIPGLLEIILPALLGSLCYLRHFSRRQPLTVSYAVFCSLIIGLIANGIVFTFLLTFMPYPHLLLDTGSGLLIFFNGPLAMALFSSLLVLEKQHTESVELHTSILQTAQDGFWLADNQGNLLEVNKAYCRMSGYSRAELLTKNISDLEASMDSQELVRRIRSVTDKGWDRFKSIHHRKDGSCFTVEVSAKLLSDNSKRAVIFLHDITDREKAEAALRESENKYKQLIETTDTGFVILDENGSVLDANMEYVRMTGHDNIKDILGRPVSDWTAPEDLQRHVKEVQKCLRVGSVRNLEVAYIGAGGRHVPVEIHANVLTGEAPPRIMSICRDISERRIAREEKQSLQEQLFKAQKMESIGTLAGGFAHDFNNILSPIIGICDILRRDLSANARLQDRVRIIQKSAYNASELVQQMLALGRQSDSSKQPVSVPEIINEVLSLVRHSLPDTIEIKLKIHASCVDILADAGQLHQVLMNLITNAFHAMESSGGVLEVGLDGISVDSKNTYEASLTPGRYLDLYVSDTGGGMDETTIEKIFDPFFTTKKAGKGTGLGLSVSYGIIKAHDGAITVTSKPGRGSVFHVYLPVQHADIKKDSTQSKATAN